MIAVGSLAGLQVAGRQAPRCLDRELEGTSAQERGVECVRLVHLVDGANEMRVFKDAEATLQDLVRQFVVLEP